MRDFAVVDVETTGLRPPSDRVVEIAVIRMRPSGEVVDTFETLVNPDRDVGSTSIHGITAEMVAYAPSFSGIAGHVIRLLKDAVFVAHNAPFDERFLLAEFERAGLRVPELPTLCTLRRARKMIPWANGHTLAACCAAVGIPYSGAHQAMADCRAVAALLSGMLRAAPAPAPDGGSPWPRKWPEAAAGSPLPRSAATGQAAIVAESLTSRLSRRLQPGQRLGVDASAYFELLCRALEDRLLLDEEVDALAGLAQEWGLSVQHVHATHRAYLLSLVSHAIADGVVTEGERKDIETVARILDIPAVEVGPMFDAASAGPHRLSAADLRGLSVCFTGESQCAIEGTPINRAEAERRAAAAGLLVKRSVSAKLNLLVVADPWTLSTKAKAARGKGVRIVAERVFWQMLGVAVE